MAETRSGRAWYRPMVSRDRGEEHRAATPLELLFDLCFVVGVSQAAGRLHHALAAGEYAHGISRYLMVFFAIWWAWVNFTWFASAYDTDDVPYRITTLVQITGALTLAAGIPSAFDNNNFTVVVIGYVVMRLAMVAQWLRAAASDPERRVTALRFAIGISLVQVGWVARLFLPAGLGVPSFLFLVLCELAVPVWAEHAAHTRWHPTHIAERYGLFTLIVLGEAILASTVAIQGAFDAGGHRGQLLALSAAGLVVVFGMWWLYFDRPGHEVLAGLRSGFGWGYGHYLIFASAAAVGAGIQVNVDVIEGGADVSARAAAGTFAVPVAVYLASVWVLHRKPGEHGGRYVAFPAVAALVLVTPLLPAPLVWIAALTVALVVVTSRTTPADAGAPGRSTN